MYRDFTTFYIVGGWAMWLVGVMKDVWWHGLIFVGCGIGMWFIAVGYSIKNNEGENGDE